MKKILNRLIIGLLSICLVLLSTVACMEKDVFKENNEIFFRQILNHREEDEIEINSLDAYKAENRYYYHVTYSYISSVTNEWKDADLVYFGAYQIDNYFSLKWENWGDMEKHRDAYYAAVESGYHKSFTKEEIQEYVDAFYSSKRKTKKPSLRTWLFCKLLRNNVHFRSFFLYLRNFFLYVLQFLKVCATINVRRN